MCEYTRVYVCRPRVSLWCPSSGDIHLVFLDRVSMLSWRSPIKQVVWLLSPRDLPVYLPGLGLCVCVCSGNGGGGGFETSSHRVALAGLEVTENPLPLQYLPCISGIFNVGSRIKLCT